MTAAEHGPNVTPNSDLPSASADTPPPVEQQREELAETVDALVRKADVPARVSAAATDAAQSAQATAKANQPALIGAAVAAVLAVVGVVVVRRRRREA
ncbi:DUF3618 domain-containing protein [Gordonia soli]|uniref:Deoxyuridine 5'-triphosphate nucleotidohydrolase n=1 Tax=Gordonia soli NBRC 108243 TaxID=1223545 RepID=M0QLK9_9ACTN|nr:DUF3618 domain-containing protein [Gordonia soli]GAC68287.1 hypothetical protein GS4_14_01190 [Gordonia soli NBRC 108243]